MINEVRKIEKAELKMDILLADQLNRQVQVKESMPRWSVS